MIRNEYWGKKELGLFVCLYIEEESLNCTHVYRKVREDTFYNSHSESPLFWKKGDNNYFCLYFWTYIYDIVKNKILLF